VPLGHADAADVDRPRRLDVVGATDQLGRPAAEVDDEVGARDAPGRDATVSNGTWALGVSAALWMAARLRAHRRRAHELADEPVLAAALPGA
jgi:hypothetical protein